MVLVLGFQQHEPVFGGVPLVTRTEEETAGSSPFRRVVVRVFKVNEWILSRMRFKRLVKRVLRIAKICQAI